jgi:hypothetical protein
VIGRSFLDKPLAGVAASNALAKARDAAKAKAAKQHQGNDENNLTGVAPTLSDKPSLQSEDVVRSQAYFFHPNESF